MYKIAIVILALTLSACQSLNTRGLYIENDKIAHITSGKLTKEQLVSILGAPTLAPGYSPDTWYYVSRTLRNQAWSGPKVLKQRVVKVSFIGDEVSEVEVIDNKHKSLDVILAHTVSKGTEENALQSFVKNFGRFNKTTREKRR